jgi:hypothetical protein
MSSDHPLQSGPVADCIEALCRYGCREVWDIIRRLEQGEQMAETHGLDPSQRHLVIAELRAVMAVYDRCDPN